jgi:hypothetical protein
MADFIFDPAVISPETKALYPEGYTMRPLARDDYHRGFLKCLQDLTWTGEITEEQFNERFDWQKAHGQGWYYCVVIVDATDRIVGTGTVVVEKKLFVLLFFHLAIKFVVVTNWIVVFRVSRLSAISKTSPSQRTTRGNTLARN